MYFCHIKSKLTDMSPELLRIKKEMDDYNVMVDLLKPFDIHHIPKPDFYISDSILSITFFVIGQPDLLESKSIDLFFESYQFGAHKSMANLARIDISLASDTLTLNKEDIALFYVCKNTSFELLTYAPTCLRFYSFYYIIAQVNISLPQDDLFLMPPSKILRHEDWEHLSFDTWYDEFINTISKNKVHVFKTFFSLAQTFRLLNEKVKSITQSHEESYKNVEKQRNDVSALSLVETPIIEIKTKTNSRLASYERMVKDYLSEVFSIPGGYLSKKIETIIDQKLDELSENKQTKNIALTIPSEICNEINALFLDAIKEFYNYASEVAENNFINLNSDLTRVLETQNINFMPQALTFRDHAVLQRLIFLADYVDRPFEKTMPVKKMMEYFSGARQGLMLIIMMATLFGLIKEMKGSPMFYPSLILVLGIGLWNIIEQTNKERNELKLKNLEAAKDHLRKEVKSKADKISKEYADTYLAKIRDKVTSRITEAENEWAIKDKSLKDFKIYEKKKLDIQYDVFKTHESKLTEWSRSSSRFEETLKKLKSNIISSVKPTPTR
jgi:hypothetical protein